MEAFEYLQTALFCLLPFLALAIIKQHKKDSSHER